MSASTQNTLQCVSVGVIPNHFSYDSHIYSVTEDKLKELGLKSWK
jgi:hypothetical protein